MKYHAADPSNDHRYRVLCRQKNPIGIAWDWDKTTCKKCLVLIQKHAEETHDES